MLYTINANKQFRDTNVNVQKTAEFHSIKKSLAAQKVTEVHVNDFYKLLNHHYVCSRLIFYAHLKHAL